MSQNNLNLALVKDKRTVLNFFNPFREIMQQYAIQCHSEPFIVIQCHSEPFSAIQCHSEPFSALLTIFAFILAILSCKRVSPCKVTVLCSWVRHLSLPVSLSPSPPRSIKWVPVICHGSLMKFGG